MSKNDFKYLDRNNTPYNLTDDSITTRKNSQFTSFEGLYRIQYFKVNRFELAITHSQNKGGLPGKEGQVTKVAGFENGLNSLQGSAHINNWLDKGLKIKTGASYTIDRPRYFWSPSLDNIGFSTGGGFVDLGSVNSKVHNDFNVQFFPTSLYLLDMYVLGAYEDLLPQEFQKGSGNINWHNRRYSVTAALDLHIYIWKQVSVTAGYHGDLIRDNTEGGISYIGDPVPISSSLTPYHSGRAGANGKILKSVSIFGNIGRYYRHPSLLDLYGGKWGILSNPDLEAEQGDNIELGIKWIFGKHYLEMTGFQNKNTNAIYYLRSANLIKPSNLEATRTRGLESHFNLKFFSKASIETNFTWQIPKNISRLSYNNKLIPNEPMWSGVSKFGFGPLLHVYGEYTFDYKSVLYRDPGNFQKIPIQFLHHFLIKWHLRKEIQIDFSIQNLTDEFYEDAYSSFPYPGRQYFVTAIINSQIFERSKILGN